MVSLWFGIWSNCLFCSQKCIYWGNEEGWKKKAPKKPEYLSLKEVAIIDLSQATCNIIPINQAFQLTNRTLFIWTWAGGVCIHNGSEYTYTNTKSKNDGGIRRSLSRLICNVYTLCNIHPFFNNNKLLYNSHKIKWVTSLWSKPAQTYAHTALNIPI